MALYTHDDRFVPRRALLTGADSGWQPWDRRWDAYEGFTPLPRWDRWPAGRGDYPEGRPGERRWRDPEAAWDEQCVEKLTAILSGYPCVGVPSEPTQIMPQLYLGTSADAENLAVVKKLGITHILNCAGGHPLGIRRQRARYTPETGVLGYEELAIEEYHDTIITGFLDRAHHLIDYWRRSGGKVLIQCPGVSRSGAVALTYLCKQGIPLLAAAQQLKTARRCVLNHEGFIRQLVTWCRLRGLIDADFDDVRAPEYGRKLNKYRIGTAHLPTFL